MSVEDKPDDVGYTDNPLPYHSDLSGWCGCPPGLTVLHCIMSVPVCIYYSTCTSVRYTILIITTPYTILVQLVIHYSPKLYIFKFKFFPSGLCTGISSS